MTSRERIRAAVQHRDTDYVPTCFECVGSVMDQLTRHYGCDRNAIFERFHSDIIGVAPKYIGPEHKREYDRDGNEIGTGFWGEQYKTIKTPKGYMAVPTGFPIDRIDSIEGLKNYPWPKTEWFDYDSIREECEKYPDKALTIGYYGPFQFATHLRSTDKVLMDMVLEPEFAHYFFDRMMEFELEHYENILKAANGRIDILKACDDYGTQRGLLFSTDMWREYFRENTIKLVDLAHKYGAVYHQHSCGAVRQLIPDLIDCGIDILEPLQKLPGMEPEALKKEYGNDLTFLGGIDTQTVLPFCTPEEVIEETKRVVDALYHDGGYILMASQSFEEDVPIENIEAMYSVRELTKKI